MKTASRFILCLALLGIWGGHSAVSAQDVPEGWTINDISFFESELVYKLKSGRSLLKIDCVGPTSSFHVMDASRSFNYTLTIFSDLSEDWMQGQKVRSFSTANGPDGREKIELEIIAMRGRFVVSPLGTEWFINRMTNGKEVDLEVIRQTEDFQRDYYPLNGAGLLDALRQMSKSCMKRYAE